MCGPNIAWIDDIISIFKNEKNVEASNEYALEFREPRRPRINNLMS